MKPANAHSLDEIFNLTKIDRWFLTQIKELMDFEEELVGAKNYYFDINYEPSKVSN